MMYLREFAQREEGQSLILVTLAIVVLFGFLAIAVDVGHVYGERRRMQNAADAGALAGAQQICLGQSTGKTIATATDYAINRNGADTATATISNQGGSGSITVTAGESVNLFLGGFLADPVMDVAATATASCGGVNRLCNFWPIALHEDIWLEVTDEFGCGAEFTVIDSERICNEDYDCDGNGDGINDIMMGGARGWLDLPWPDTLLFPTPCHRNCGENKLGCFLENPYPGAISLPACIASEPGTMDSAFKTAGDQAGKIVLIPLFDRKCGAGDPATLGDCGGHQSYHIVGLGCVEIVSYEKKFAVWDIKNSRWGKEKALRVKVNCSRECYAGCSATGGAAPPTGGARGVSILQ